MICSDLTLIIILSLIARPPWICFFNALARLAASKQSEEADTKLFAVRQGRGPLSCLTSQRNWCLE